MNRYTDPRKIYDNANRLSLIKTKKDTLKPLIMKYFIQNNSLISDYLLNYISKAFQFCFLKEQTTDKSCL